MKPESRQFQLMHSKMILPQSLNISQDFASFNCLMPKEEFTGQHNLEVQVWLDLGAQKTASGLGSSSFFCICAGFTLRWLCLPS
jgi:hypothetical protein